MRANEVFDENEKDVEIMKISAEKLQRRMAEVFRPLITYMQIPDFSSENILKIVKTYTDALIIAKMDILGQYEWCCVDEKVKLVSVEEELDGKQTLSIRALRYISNKREVTAMEVDRYIGKYFKTDIVKNIAKETTAFLDTDDTKKLKQAMIDFNAKRYLESAYLFASLIDAQSIKQELFDIKHGRYVLENIKNGEPWTSQGWTAFYIVFANNFCEYFDKNKFNGNPKKKKREKGFNEFIKNIEGKMPSESAMHSLLELAFCLLKFFNDSNWTNYPDNKPDIINRHWLMHGMYDMKDITKYDCIKLLLMLNQLSKLYSKLKIGEI